MKLKQLGSNQTLLITNHGYEILYSYETPVAGYSPILGWFKTSKKYSRTTNKHINKYLNGNKACLLCPTDLEQMGMLIGEV
jgi:hypothetical protein